MICISHTKKFKKTIKLLLHHFILPDLFIYYTYTYFILMQVEAQRQAKEASEAIHHEKFKLEILKQKSRHDQSAVASPEVKRHLAEFVLKKKRQEASAVSMSNLKMVPTAPPPTHPHALLRKTASESNLLKMKPGKRSTAHGHGTSSPYQRMAITTAIPENEVQGGSLQV